MINAITKYMITSMIVSGFAIGITTESLLYYMGSAASIIFGFLLQLSHTRRTKQLTVGMIWWNSIATLCICWFMALIWHMKVYPKWFYSFGDIGYVAYLFWCSFMALMLSEGIYSLSNTSIKNWRQKVARSLLMDDKEEKQ